MQIFFDFDGTLADSSPGIYASFEHACLDQGLVAPPYEDFCASIGPPVEVLARQFFPRLVAAELESFRQTFRHVYDQGQFRLCNWYDGVEQTLGAISEFPGVRLAIITNKPTIPTFKLLASAELTSYFELIAGIDYRVVQGIGSTFMQKSEGFSSLRLSCHPIPRLVFTLVTHHQIDTLALLAALSLLLPLMGFILGRSQNSIVLCTCRGSRS